LISKFSVPGVHSGGNTGCSEVYSLFSALSLDLQNYFTDQVTNNINLALTDLLLLVEQQIGDLLAGNVDSITISSQDDSILGSFANEGEPAALCIVQFVLGV
jgi:hypothetical protein